MGQLFLLQVGSSAITNWDSSIITNQGSYYKLGQTLLQVRAVITNWGITNIYSALYRATLYFAEKEENKSVYTDNSNNKVSFLLMNKKIIKKKFSFKSLDSRVKETINLIFEQ